MSIRCREGDLALITHEEPGCDVNIGRIVNVGGPIRLDPLRGPTWLIEPAAAEPWSYVVPGGERIVIRPIRFADCIEHPDAWLLPLRPGGDELVEASKRVVQREIQLEVPDQAVVEEAGG